jgi:hypothetical protein
MIMKGECILNKKLLLSLSTAMSISLVAACGGGEESNEGNTNEGNNMEAENQTEEPAENNEAAAEGDETAEGEEAAGEGNETAQQEQPEMPEPDLEDVPDTVAEVNGEEILKEDFASNYEGQFMQAAQQAQMTQEEIDQDQLKEQVAENMVGTELLIQEAESRDYDVSEEDVNETLDELAAQNGLESGDELLSALQEQGLEEEEIMDQAEMQVKIDRLLSEESGDAEPTEEELEEAYDQMTAQQEQMSGEGGEDVEMPSYEEVKPELEEQVAAQKEAEQSQQLVEDLREDADVTINL